MYIHEHKTWPQFVWDADKLHPLLLEIRHQQGRLLGRMQALGFQVRNEATLQILTQDVLKTSEIEGERLNAVQVRSSLARRLGMDIGALAPVDRHVEGIVEVMLDATQHWQAPLTQERLWNWHAALFPTGRSGMHWITVGGWRTQASGPMQVVSGPHGREKVHYEAPEANRLDEDMRQFLAWFNSSAEIDPVLKSALSHFWFVMIHPFEDGNGRIARAIADLVLARSEQSSQRFYSMSAQIQHDRKDYYAILERCSKSDLDITVWMEWFSQCLKRAMLLSEKTLESVIAKANFWMTHQGETFNARQRLMLNRLLDDNFVGKLTSSKWAKISKCSQDTALRDITELVERQILIKEKAGGRSTNYQLPMM